MCNLSIDFCGFQSQDIPSTLVEYLKEWLDQIVQNVSFNLASLNMDIVKVKP